MGTFKQGDKIVVRLEGTYLGHDLASVHNVSLELETGDKDSITTMYVSADKIVEHEMSEPTKVDTVVKVDGRIFVLGETSKHPNHSKVWFSKAFRYTWEELKTLGDVEVIYEPESEDV